MVLTDTNRLLFLFSNIRQLWASFASCSFREKESNPIFDTIYGQHFLIIVNVDYLQSVESSQNAIASHKIYVQMFCFVFNSHNWQLWCCSSPVNTPTSEAVTVPPAQHAAVSVSVQFLAFQMFSFNLSFIIFLFFLPTHACHVDKFDQINKYKN